MAVKSNLTAKYTVVITDESEKEYSRYYDNNFPILESRAKARCHKLSSKFPGKNIQADFFEWSKNNWKYIKTTINVIIKGIENE